VLARNSIRVRSCVTTLLFLTTFIVSLVDLNALAAESSQEAAVDKLFTSWNTRRSPGCAVAVMKDGHIVYKHGYGMAVVEQEAKIIPTTVFNVGSIAKQFTGAAILMLAQESKLSLADPIRKYVTEVPDFGTPITLQEMLSHTSGLRDYEQLLRFDGWRLDSPDLLTDGDIMYIVGRQRELNFRPGTDFSYSNTNYELLAQVVSRVSKQSFPDFTMTRLFQPLGMTHTHFRTDHGEAIKNAAFAYVDTDHGVDLCLPNYDTVGATNLMTTVEDLALWEENFYTGRVGGVEMMRQLRQPGKLSDGTQLNYAPGTFVSVEGQGIKEAETGTAGDAGYRADVLRYPDSHFSVITFCNLASIDPMALNHSIAAIYLGRNANGPSPNVTGSTSSFHGDQKQLAVYAGIYVDQDENHILKLNQRADALWCEWFTGPSAIGPAPLEALGEHRFRGSGLKEIDFGTGANPVEIAVINVGAPTVHYRRVPSYKPTAAELRDFAGIYSSKELDVPAVLTIEGEALILHPAKMLPITLVPITNDLFIGGDWRVRFARDSQAHVSGLLMGGSWNRAENLRFEKVPER
jgi:CubicO group peptidase (beta-lactamase class C family)